MHIRTILLTAVLLVAPLLAMAEDSAALRKQIMMDQKKLIVMENMDLTEAEAQAFWPAFEKNQEELFQINQRGARLILAYADAYETLTDEQSLALIKEYNDIQDMRQVLMKKMTDDVSKALPGKKAFRYMQIEAKLAAIARYELAREIPLVQ